MSDHEPVTVANFMRRLTTGWDAFNAYIDSLTEAQLTQPTDAAGWTVKDHLTHLAVWEDGMNALLRREPRHEAMGLDEATWNSGDYDAMNAVIRERYKDVSVADARQMMANAHTEFAGRVQQMTDAELMRPYDDYQPHSDQTHEIIWSFMGNTVGHYEEHQLWIEAIVRGE